MIDCCDPYVVVIGSCRKRVCLFLWEEWVFSVRDKYILSTVGTSMKAFMISFLFQAP